MIYSEGLEIQYKDFIGTIRFVCNSYITFCVRVFPDEKNRDVCILIYPSEFGKIRLLKQSDK